MASIFIDVLKQILAARPDMHLRELHAEGMAGLSISPTAKAVDSSTPAQLESTCRT